MGRGCPDFQHLMKSRLLTAVALLAGWPGHGGALRQGAINRGSQAAQGSPEDKEGQ